MPQVPLNKKMLFKLKDPSLTHVLISHILDSNVDTLHHRKTKLAGQNTAYLVE